jgi:hypothetical protein
MSPKAAPDLAREREYAVEGAAPIVMIVWDTVFPLRHFHLPSKGVFS